MASVHNSGREEYSALLLGPVIGGVAGGFLGSTLHSEEIVVVYHAP